MVLAKDHDMLDSYTDSHNVITKDVLDNQLLDGQFIKNEINETSLVPRFDPDVHINLHYVLAYYCGPQYEDVRTRVSEKPYIMQWRGEHFKCRVGISLQSSVPTDDWTIGLVQACSKISLKNQFAEGGYYSWEFQPLKSKLHRMVNDSNGSQWPFYSHNGSLVDLKAGSPIKEKFYELRYSDFFYPTMHWTVESGGRIFPLTKVSRRQTFFTWLVAIKRSQNNTKGVGPARYLHFMPEDDQLFVLKQMQWKYNIKLKFDVYRKLGSRCTFIDDAQKTQPVVFDTIDPIPRSALVAPNCNSCQSLIFYPKNKEHPLVLRKMPEDIVVPWNQWRQSMTAGYSNLRNFEKPNPVPRMFATKQPDKYVNHGMIYMSERAVPEQLKRRTFGQTVKRLMGR